MSHCSSSLFDFFTPDMENIGFQPILLSEVVTPSPSIMFCPNEIIIHCTASSQSLSLEDLRTYHVYQRGFSDIGYHFIIFPNGEIKVGRPITQMGAHCKGHNLTSIGIAWVGGLNGVKNLTPEQSFSLSRTCMQLHSSLVYPIDTLSTHHFYNPHKTCPNYTLHELFPDSVLSLFKHING